MATACEAAGILICGLQRVAAGIDYVAGVIKLEISRAGISDGAGWQFDLEESLALNHHVEGIIGFLKAALGEDDGVGGGTSPPSRAAIRWERWFASRRSCRAESRSGREDPETACGASCSQPCWHWARLLAMVSMLICCAVIPLAALYKALIIWKSPNLWKKNLTGPGDVGEHLLVHFGA